MAKTSKSKSLDDIFADTPKQEGVKNPIKVSTNTSLDALFPEVVGDVNKPASSESKAFGKAAFGGLARGASAGYSDRLLSDNSKKEMTQYPTTGMITTLLGGAAPGVAVAKGVSAVGKAFPFLSALSKGGTVAGATEGAVLGGVSDPGENGSRLENAGTGAVLGGGLGTISKFLSRSGAQKDIANEMVDPNVNLPAKIKSKYDQAVADLMANEVTPQKSELTSILKDKSVNINPDYLRGFERPALMGKPRDKGGLGVLADILERKNGVGGKSEIPATKAQDLKEYFQKSSNFSKRRPLSPSSEANNAKSDTMRRYMKDKISALDPKVDELNNRMQDSLNLKDQLTPQFEQDPIAAVSQRQSSTRGNLLQELDKKSGSKLADYGQNVRGAKDIVDSTPADILSLNGPNAVMGLLKRYGVGQAGQIVNKMPTGTRQSIIESILQNIRQSQDETDNIE